MSSNRNLSLSLARAVDTDVCHGGAVVQLVNYATGFSHIFSLAGPDVQLHAAPSRNAGDGRGAVLLDGRVREGPVLPLRPRGGLLHPLHVCCSYFPSLFLYFTLCVATHCLRSPIRRYAGLAQPCAKFCMRLLTQPDVIVHRQLQSSLDGAPPLMDNVALAELAEHLNWSIFSPVILSYICY